MKLFTPTWNNKDEEKAVKAVQKIVDEAKLARVALEARCRKARITAAEMLTDVSTIEHIAENSNSIEVRQATERRLQRVLADIAKNATDYDTRSAAIEKITDQAVLLSIAKSNSYHNLMRANAVGKLTNSMVLEELAQNADSTDVRSAATAMLTDQQLLSKIAKEDEDWAVRLAAVRMLTNQQLLFEIAKEDKDHYVSEAAIQGLTDQSLLAALAKNDDITAIKKLTDEAILEYIVNSDKSSDIRSIARVRICEITEHDWDGCVCKKCFSDRHQWVDTVTMVNSFSTCSICGKVTEPYWNE